MRERERERERERDLRAFLRQLLNREPELQSKYYTLVYLPRYLPTSHRGRETFRSVCAEGPATRQKLSLLSPDSWQYVLYSVIKISVLFNRFFFLLLFSFPIMFLSQ